MSAPRNVGLDPWLPWPLSSFSWWTKPVAAERLAALRIAFAACLVADIALTHVPHSGDFYAPDSLGSAEILIAYGDDTLWWSLWRGPGDQLMSALALIGFVVSFAWLATALIGRRWSPERARLLRPALLVIGCAGFVAAGALARSELAPSLPSWLGRWLAPWQKDDAIITWAMDLWLAAAVCLLLGFQSRAAAFVCWASSCSFENINYVLDNAGDTVKITILFYLMLCPCGTAWSLDRCWQVIRRRAPGPAVVPPWPLRLLFLQMMFIYFCNGIYKVSGLNWVGGESLYYTLCDLSLARFSFDMLALPEVVTKLMTWTVLAWEISFPLLVLFRWTRKPALIMGVFFHLGILATMELGFFQLYMLSLYVPLLPWERWLAGPPE